MTLIWESLKIKAARKCFCFIFMSIPFFPFHWNGFFWKFLGCIEKNPKVFVLFLATDNCSLLFFSTPQAGIYCVRVKNRCFPQKVLVQWKGCFPLNFFLLSPEYGLNFKLTGVNGSLFIDSRGLWIRTLMSLYVAKQSSNPLWCCIKFTLRLMMGKTPNLVLTSTPGSPLSRLMRLDRTWVSMGFCPKI